MAGSTGTGAAGWVALARARGLFPAAQRRAAAEGAADAVGRVLDRLRDQGWTVLHDVRRPGAPGTDLGAIPHVVAGPAGVFVVAGLDWRGEVNVRGDLLYCAGRESRDATATVDADAAALGDLLAGLRATPVLCFVRDESVAGTAGATLLCSTSNLARTLAGLPEALDRQELDHVAHALRFGLRPAPGSRARLLHRLRTTLTGAGTTEIRRDARRSGWWRPAVAACAVVVALVGVSHLGSSAQTPHRRGTAPGEQVTVPGTATRPTLQLTAGRPVPTRSADEVRVPAGQRLVAVRLRVRDAGVRAITVRGLRARLVDAHRVGHAPETRVRSAGVGRLLPAAVRLRPGHATTGYLVFLVPARVGLRQVRVTVPGADRTAVWTLAH